MEIFNRPPSIAEDTLHYSIYPSPVTSDKASATALAACITDFVNTMLSSSKFIWHRDAFEVKVIQNPDNDGSWILEGRMRVGDCIDDEWCTVWLLKEITAKWDVVISVYDSDGEFLLIEAAEALPSWVKPANSENRVWIHNSRLHLIPLIQVSPPSRERRRRRKLPNAPDSDEELSRVEEDDEFISVVDALRLVRDPVSDTFASLAVQKIIWERIANYPAALQSHVHMTKAYIPQDIIKALSLNPALIQRAIETFYTRDSIQLRVAHRMSRFPPSTSVLASVRMTRTAYAQLSGQKFFPPKIFGQWKEPEGSTIWRWKDTGMKIAVGFEMLYQESKSRQNNSSEGTHSSAETTKDALQRDPDYQKYISSLVSANYFKGELQGSELWRALENKAALAFVEARRTDDNLRPSFASQVDTAIRNVKELPQQLDLGEDSEEWLNVDAETFDQLLENKLGKRKSDSQRDPNAMVVDNGETTESPEDRLASDQAKKLKDLAKKVENFIEGEGDVEGARFEDEEFSDEPFSDDESENNDSETEIPIAERQIAMDKLVPALDPSDYGAMPPSYYNKSQRVAPTTMLTDGVPKLSKAETPNGGLKTKTKPIRPPIIPRDNYDGVDSDDETDMEEDESEDEEDRPQVVGEVEIDMQEEEEEFIEFSRQALGISDEQWAEIVRDRKERGAFLPSSATDTSKSPKKPTKEEPSYAPHKNEPNAQPKSNQDLNSFDAVMKALDEVLAQNQPKKAKAPEPAKQSPPKDTKGKNKATIEDEMAMEDDGELDVEAAMDAELKQLLDGDDFDSDEPLDYNLIKNFLESFKSQAGLSGPVGNLAGRLAPNLKFPRDGS